MKRRLIFPLTFGVGFGFLFFGAVLVAEAQTSGGFNVGDEVRTTDDLNVRSAPSTTGDILGVQLNFSHGRILTGPVLAGGYTWWNVDYDYIPDGWSAGEFLTLANPVSPPASGTTSPPSSSPPPTIQPPSVSVPAFYAGNRIRVGPGGGEIRYGPYSGSLKIADLAPGVEGVVVSGPFYSGGVDWWQVEVNNNGGIINGWMRQGALQLINLAPVISSISGPTRIEIGEGGTWTVIFNDPEGGIVDLGVQWGDGASEQILATTGPSLIFNHTFNQVGTFTIIITATDEAGSVGNRILVVRVVSPNSPPVFGAITGPLNLAVSSSGAWQVTASDPDNDSLTYTVNWGDGATNSYSDPPGLSGGPITITHAYSQSGTYTIVVTVSDGEFSANGSLVVAVDSTVLPGVSTKFKIGDRVIVTANLNVRSGQQSGFAYLGLQSKNAKGGVVGGPVFWNGYWYWQINYDSGVDGWSAEDWLEKYTPPGTSTQGPSAEISGPTSAVVGEARSWNFIAYDPDTATISFTVNWGDGTSNSFSGPSGQQRTLSHTYTQAGSKIISVVASDGVTNDGEQWGVGVIDKESAISPPLVPVILNQSGALQATVGVSFSLQILLRDYDTNVLGYTISWGDGTPILSGTAVSGQAFTVSHTYTTAGIKNLLIFVSDGNSSESYAPVVFVK